MPISAHRSDNGQTLVISVEGRFDFSSHQAFRDAYEQADGGVERYIIDLSETTYLDSSALGMLLMLREHVGGELGNIRLQVSDVPEIRRVVEIARFGDLFALE